MRFFLIVALASLLSLAAIGLWRLAVAREAMSETVERRLEPPLRSPAPTPAAEMWGLEQGLPSGVATFWIDDLPPIRRASPYRPVALRQDKVSLGRVAQATKKTQIYSQFQSDAGTPSWLKPGAYIVVRDYDGGYGWAKVLLASMSYAYVHAADIRVLDYEYVVDRKTLDSFVPKTSQQEAAWKAFRMLGHKVTPEAFAAVVYQPLGARSLDSQVTVGKPVRKLEDLQSGDRLYFDMARDGRLDDFGVYWGKGWFLHAGKQGVAMKYLGDSKWLNPLVAARR